MRELAFVRLLVVWVNQFGSLSQFDFVCRGDTTAPQWRFFWRFGAFSLVFGFLGIGFIESLGGVFALELSLEFSDSLRWLHVKIDAPQSIVDDSQYECLRVIAALNFSIELRRAELLEDLAEAVAQA